MNRPDLSGAKIISHDIETYDPYIEAGLGTSVYRPEGCVLGMSIATDDGFAEYYNLGHRGITEEEREGNIAYLRDVLALPIPKVGANYLYDMDWTENWRGCGIKIHGPFNDVQVAEPLLDEYSHKYNLDNLAAKYLGEHKKKERPQEICDANGWKGDFRKHLWKMTYEDVRDYAIGDADQPIRILALQLAELEKQGLLDLYRMEMRLYPLLISMRKNGVRISEVNREKAREQLTRELKVLEDDLFGMCGDFNYNSGQQVALVFDELGIPYETKEETGNPIMNKDFLETVDHPIAEKIVRAKGIAHILGTYIEGAFTEHCVDGRVHCNFKPTKQEEGGTVSGRFSASDPALQGIPSRDEEFSSLCRGSFIPEEECDWGKLDLSQIEYRLIANYARGERAEEIRDRYRNDPNTDYHQLIMDWTGVDRFTAKRLNFGMAYFMGSSSMARKFHYTLEEATALQQKYMDNVPFMSPTRQAVVTVGESRGYIRTILGRRARVTPSMRGGLDENGDKQKKKTYVLFNRLIQGSAADLLKKAMVDSWEAGLYEILTPHLTVHDELDVSIPRTRIAREAFRELRRIMETAVLLKVPVISDGEVGPSWGDLTELSDRPKRDCVLWTDWMKEVV